MVGEVCRNVGCEKKIFPPRDICPYCNKPANIEQNFSGRGEVYSFTTVRDNPPAGFEKYVPYVEALVKLEEGPMVTAMLTDLEMEWGPEEIDGEIRQVGKFKVEIGMPVEMVTRKYSEDGERGLINYSYKFRPPIRAFSESEQGLIFKVQEAEVPVSY
jgi:hypothetical protein